MPSSTSKDWFITISTRSIEDVPLDVVHTLTTCNQKYYAVLEHGKDHAHPHIHVAIWTDTEVRQDVVRRKWISRLKLQDQNRSVVVKPMTDATRLIGQYLQKEDEFQLLWSNIPPDDVQDMVNRCGKTPKPQKLKHIPNSVLPDTIFQYSLDHNHQLQTPDGMMYVISRMYQDGYRFSSAMRSLKYVWSELQMISGRTISWADYNAVY